LEEIFYNVLHNFVKNTTDTHELTEKYGLNVMIENFIETKSRRKFLKGLKWKVIIFIGTKNIFNIISVAIFIAIL